MSKKTDEEWAKELAANRPLLGPPKYKWRPRSKNNER